MVTMYCLTMSYLDLIWSDWNASSRCEDLVSCHNILHIWGTRSLFVMVSSTLQSFQVCGCYLVAQPTFTFANYVISFGPQKRFQKVVA